MTNKSVNLFQGTISSHFNRRSFITKSTCGSLGIMFKTGLEGSNSGSYKITGTKEEIYKQIDGLVYKFFPIYRTCSQTTFQVLNEIFELKSDNITKALASFPGIAMRGETCGAVTASLLAIGLVYEENMVDKERKRLSFAPSVKFCSVFEGEYGSTRCRDVIEHESGKKYPLIKPEDYQAVA